jgi:capsular polysaccharide biosynthesis protein/Mrp family chromosome partitioning ATPase
MGLRDYLEILWRRRLAVLLPVLAAAALVAAPALLQPATYRSTTTLFFAPRDPAQSTALAGQRLASYVALVRGPRLAQAVAQQLALPQDEASVDDLASRLTATAQPESLLVDLAATGASPQDAQRLAQTAASQLVELAAALEPPATGTQTSPVWLTIAEPAQPGIPLDRAALIQDVVLALVLGLAGGSALAFLAEALDPRVVDARGLRRIAPGAVLSLAVPRTAGRNGDGPQEEEAAVPPPGAVRVLRTALLGHALPDAGTGARVLVVTGTSQEGATGTVASWIATALTRSGRDVVLVRAGVQDGTHPDGAGITRVLPGQDVLDVLSEESLDGRPRVLVLGREAADPGEVLAAPGVTELVRQLSELFDHVVIEAPPVLPYVETALLAAQCADQVVLVVRPGWARRRQVRSAVAVLAQQHAPVTLSVLTRLVRGGVGRPAVTELPAAAPHPQAEGEAAAGRSGTAGAAGAVGTAGAAGASVDDLDAELDGELDAALDAELDEDGPVLSGGGPARGGDA